MRKIKKDGKDEQTEKEAAKAEEDEKDRSEHGFLKGFKKYHFWPT